MKSVYHLSTSLYSVDVLSNKIIMSLRSTWGTTDHGCLTTCQHQNNYHHRLQSDVFLVSRPSQVMWNSISSAGANCSAEAKSLNNSVMAAGGSYLQDATPDKC